MGLALAPGEVGATLGPIRLRQGETLGDGGEAMRGSLF